MAAEPLVCVVYVSTAARLMPEADLEQILEVSRRNNAADGITGQLIYADGNFIQAIEGPEGRIDTLLGRLRTDPRHKRLAVIARWEIERRAFANWTMAYRRMPGDAEEIAACLPNGPGTDRHSLAARLLAEFREGNPFS